MWRSPSGVGDRRVEIDLPAGAKPKRVRLSVSRVSHLKSQPLSKSVLEFHLGLCPRIDAACDPRGSMDTEEPSDALQPLVGSAFRTPSARIRFAAVAFCAAVGR